PPLTSSPIQNGQNLGTSGVTGSPSCSSAASLVSPVGSYTITCLIGTLAAGNYSFSFVDGTLTVGTAVLTVTADDQTRIYGDANPAFTVTYSGFKNGENQAVVSGSPSCSTPAVATSAVSTYPITCTQGTLSATNYDFSFVA